MANVDPKLLNPFAEIGSTGLRRWGGLVYEEFLRELSGARAIEVYKEMSSNDPIVSAILFTIEMLIRNAKWDIEPASTAREDVEAQEFLESCRDDMQQSWADTIAEVLSMLSYGWSYHEIVYKVRRGDSFDELLSSRFNDGRIGWRKLPIRAQDTLFRWNFDDAGEIRGFVQAPPPDYKHRDVPMTRALLFRTTAHKGNPEGRSILRGAYRPWFFKKHIETMEAIGVERDLAGIPIAWVPPRLLDPNASLEDKQALASYKKMATNLKRDEQEGMVYPLQYDENGNKVYDFTLLATGGTRQFDTNGIVNRYDQRIAMQVLADFVLLGHEKVGSFALNSSKTNLFATAIGAWLSSIAEIMNKVAIPRLFRMNNFTVTKLPRLVPGDIEAVDLTELGAYITSLSGAGAQLFPDADLETWLKRQAKMPVRDEHAGYADDRDMVPLQQGAQPMPAPSTAAEGAPQLTTESQWDVAQIKSIKEVIASVARREIPRNSGVELLVAACKLQPEVAERVMGDTGNSFFAQTAAP